MTMFKILTDVFYTHFATEGVSSAAMASSISSSSSKSNKSSVARHKQQVHLDSPFPEAIAETDYRTMLHFPMDYDIYLDNSGWHWFILVQAKLENTCFPYITLEVTTNKKHNDLIPTMRVIQKTNIDEPHITAVSFAQKTLLGTIVKFSRALSKGGVEAVMQELKRHSREKDIKQWRSCVRLLKTYGW